MTVWVLFDFYSSDLRKVNYLAKIGDFVGRGHKRKTSMGKEIRQWRQCSIKRKGKSLWERTNVEERENGGKIDMVARDWMKV